MICVDVFFLGGSSNSNTGGHKTIVPGPAQLATRSNLSSGIRKSKAFPLPLAPRAVRPTRWMYSCARRPHSVLRSTTAGIGMDQSVSFHPAPGSQSYSGDSKQGKIPLRFILLRTYALIGLRTHCP